MRCHSHLQKLLAGGVLLHESRRIHAIHHFIPRKGDALWFCLLRLTWSVLQVSGDQAVMQEIVQNGPVACRICESRTLHSYQSGSFSDPDACESGSSSNQFIVLSGWDERNGKRFWIGRNSWGTYWGIRGWFHLAMGDGDLGVTRECYWATPEQPTYRYLFSGGHQKTKVAAGLRDVFLYASQHQPNRMRPASNT